MASIRNIVLVALMQLGVIVAGVLAAGICRRYGVAFPWPTLLLYNCGIMGLFVPLAWGAGAVALQLRANVSDDIRTLMFAFGILVLITLAIFCIYADISPWLNIMTLGNNGDDLGE